MSIVTTLHPYADVSLMPVGLKRAGLVVRQLDWCKRCDDLTTHRHECLDGPPWLWIANCERCPS